MLGCELVKSEVLAFPIICQVSEHLDDSDSQALQVIPTEEVVVKHLEAQAFIACSCKGRHVSPRSLLAEEIVEDLPHSRHVIHECCSEVYPSIGAPNRTRVADERTSNHLLIIRPELAVLVTDRGVICHIKGVELISHYVR